MTRAAPAVPTFPDRGWFEKLDGILREDAELAVIGRRCILDLAVVVGEGTGLLRL